MKQSGRNQRQPAANETAVEPHESGKTVAVGGGWLPIGAHGKEGGTFVNKRLFELTITGKSHRSFRGCSGT